VALKYLLKELGVLKSPVATDTRGVAVDDFCHHAWTAEEIEADALSDGRFVEMPVR
jgi:hypothetical protein